MAKPDRQGTALNEMVRQRELKRLSAWTESVVLPTSMTIGKAAGGKGEMLATLLLDGQTCHAPDAMRSP